MKKQELDLIIESSNILEDKKYVFKQIEGGVSAKTFKIQSQGKSYILRCFKNSEWNRIKLSREFQLGNYLNSVEINTFKVPRPLEIVETQDCISLISEFIEGENLDNLKSLESLLVDLQEILSEVRDLPIENLDFLEDPKVIFQKLLDRRVTSISDKAFDIVNKLDFSEIMTNKKILVHGDIWPGNMIYCSKKNLYLIDWETSFLGDPLYDLANLELELLWKFPREVVEKFVAEVLAQSELNSKYYPYWQLLMLVKSDNFLEWPGFNKEEQLSMKKVYSEQMERLTNNVL